MRVKTLVGAVAVALSPLIMILVVRPVSRVVLLGDVLVVKVVAKMVPIALFVLEILKIVSVVAGTRYTGPLPRDKSTLLVLSAMIRSPAPQSLRSPVYVLLVGNGLDEEIDRTLVSRKVLP